VCCGLSMRKRRFALVNESLTGPLSALSALLAHPYLRGLSKSSLGSRLTHGERIQ